MNKSIEDMLKSSKFEVKTLFDSVTLDPIVNLNLNLNLDLIFNKKLEYVNEDEFNKWFGEWFWNSVKEKCEVKF